MEKPINLSMGRAVLVLLYISGFVWCTLGNKTTVRPEARIVGGEIASPNEFPHHVLVATEAKLPQGAGFMICGGSIISSQYVLTAAHCLHKLNTGTTQIFAGAHELHSIPPASRQTFKAKKVFIHPCFKPNPTIAEFRNDIALIRLARPVFFDGFSVTPMKVDVKNRAVENGTVTIIGWGRTDEMGSMGNAFARVLKKADLRIITEKQCKRDFLLLKFFDNESQVCAANEFDASFACQGDSGGPLICKGNDTKYVCGITSFVTGLGCTRSPSVYTRVSHFKNWIEDVVKTGRQSSLDCVAVAGAEAGRLIIANLGVYYCGILVLISLKYIL